MWPLTMDVGAGHCWAAYIGNSYFFLANPGSFEEDDTYHSWFFQVRSSRPPPLTILVPTTPPSVIMPVILTMNPGMSTVY